MRRRRVVIAAVVALAMVACSTDPAVVAVQSDVATTSPTVGASTVPSTDPGTSTSQPGTVPATSVDVPQTTVVDGATGDGIGDVLFPDLGNPGVDVLDYAVDLVYDPVGVRLAGSVTLTMQLTQQMSSFTLDSLGPVVSSVTVDGVDADFVMESPELRITLPSPETADSPFTVTVVYDVSPDGGNSSVGLPTGWISTGAGSWVLNEPDGARTWLPSNDHPADKATWTIAMTVPEGTTAVANGSLVSTTAVPTGTRWEWRQSQPMSTYLVLLVTGDYELVDGTGPNGLPLLSAVLREDRTAMQPYIDGISAEIDFFDDLFGPYPLDTYGIAMTDSAGGLAMETQGRSFFSRTDFHSGQLGYVEQLLLSHELAHQWFGDAVSPARWQDIWLNESFATYAQWLWLDHVGLTSLEDEANGALAGRQDDGGAPTGAPTVDDLFGFNSYDGGAVVLHALRRTIGDDHFFTLLQRWVADNRGTSRTTDDFVALAESVSAMSLDDFFARWLFSSALPATFP